MAAGFEYWGKHITFLLLPIGCTICILILLFNMFNYLIPERQSHIKTNLGCTPHTVAASHTSDKTKEPTAHSITIKKVCIVLV